MPSKELVAFYMSHGFVVDVELTRASSAFFDENLLHGFRDSPYEALYDFGFLPERTTMAPSLAYLHDIAKAFIREISHDSAIEILRRSPALQPETLENLLNAAPFAVGIEHVDADWLYTLWENLGDVFNTDVASTDQTIADYLRAKNDSINVVGRVFFHLVEHKSDDYPFAFLATYSTGTKDSVNHVPLNHALLEYKDQQSKLLALLSTISNTVEQSELISGLVESGEIFHPLRFTVPEAYSFLREIDLYESHGIVCRMPDWWHKKSGGRVSLSVGNQKPAGIGLSALIDCSPKLSLDDVPMTKEEIEELLTQTNGLSYIKGKWVEIDHDKLQQLLRAFDAAEKLDGMTLADALRMQLGLDRPATLEHDEVIEVRNGTWLNAMQSRLVNPPQSESIDGGDHFKATLRPYQQAGLNWLYAMQSLGFGALLADDMGLGKTVQLLALLEYTRTHAGTKTLLVVPASLLHNWQKEADRFAPKLTYRVIHSDSKDFALEEADLFITTYGMAARLETLQDTLWDMLIIDEAQAIKNPATKQTRAIKQLQAPVRIALTGTPIENRLSDLWSIFDFLNKGLLGTSKEFTAFTKTLGSDHTKYATLRSAISPFILRRLKTDKTVIADLPEKVEMKTYTTLSKKQLVLYKALVQDLQASLEDAQGISRKGLVLASIMKFKQICNHPDHYTGQKEFKPEHSGKFSKLAELCETVRDKREKMLVFTQFKEMTEPLACYLEQVFGAEGLVLHGQTPVKARGLMADRFNSDEYLPFMVLSLKAGGVGLNLTAANHVVHFDRWWNPAVENQATDRAFRIGQTKNVLVHKFVTTDTLEERIDLLLEEKQKLADDIIASSGEAWITEMSNEDIMNLVALPRLS